MKTHTLIRFCLVMILVAADTAGAQTATLGCSAGQAVQGIDFASRRLVCVSVVSSAQLAALQTQLSRLNDTINTLQAALGAETTARQGADRALHTAIAALQTGNALMQALVPYVSVVPGPLNGVTGPHIVFQGVNVHIRSGSGATLDTTNLGNLFVGYNEPRLGTDISHRTGSHNLIIGPEHQYSKSGGFLAGFGNTTSGAYASVSGGLSNTASGDYASVGGGTLNSAGGGAASVSGGTQNKASGNYASVSGGSQSAAIGSVASVSGGSTNTADGDFASVSGGNQNHAGGRLASVSGGSNNTADGDFASVSGGNQNRAGGRVASVSGGSNNTAYGDFASVSGGYNNVAGFAASVSGGYNNAANGSYASVSGGQARAVTDTASWAAGGLFQAP